MDSLKDIRKNKKLTQQEAADMLGVSLRSYITYENDSSKVENVKYRFFVSELEKANRIDEDHGVLTQDEIIRVCGEIMPEYDVNYCYLFGSYAKGKAVGTSDVDLVISGKVTGMKYYGLVEKLRQGLHKKVDALSIKQLVNNEELLDEVLKEGIRIYG